MVKNKMSEGFKGLILTFVEVAGERLAGDIFGPPILNRVKYKKENYLISLYGIGHHHELQINLVNSLSHLRNYFKAFLNSEFPFLIMSDFLVNFLEILQLPKEPVLKLWYLYKGCIVSILPH